MKAAATATGITDSRLRTWERRYGVPGPGRSASGRRLYTEDDLLIVRRMAALVGAGVSAAQAAESILAGDATSALAEPAPPQVHPGLEPLFAAVRHFDGATLQADIRRWLAELDWPETFAQVIAPLLRAVGDGWESGLLSPAHEHLVSEAVRAELFAALAATPPAPSDAPLILLACPEDERHDLGLLTLRLLLVREGHRALSLGADLPAESLIGAVRDANPAAVCLAATTAASSSTLGQAARAIIQSRLTVLLFVGGPAFIRAPAPAVPGVRLPADLGEAAELITRMLAAETRGTRRG